MNDQTTNTSSRLEVLLARRSASPKRLQAPGPSSDELDGLMQAALRAPDHGGLHPWRVIEFDRGNRESLGHCFELEKLRRDPLASPLDLQRAREHATSAPVLLGFVVSIQRSTVIPVREQWLSAGAALGNILNAAHYLGYGAIVLSGDRCFDPILTGQLGVTQHECLAGFISLGTIKSAPPTKKTLHSHAVLSRWSGPAKTQRSDGDWNNIASKGDSVHPLNHPNTGSLRAYLTKHLRGRRILYVAGRPSSTPAICGLVTGHGGIFQLNEGGSVREGGRLAQAISTADLIVYPMDCMGRESASALQRMCARLGVPIVAMRQAETTCFITAICNYISSTDSGTAPNETIQIRKQND